MKRITAIDIENYRAFKDKYRIELEQGENLLIYGENGSGKSSLFKASSDFFSSARDASIAYVRNNFLANNIGKIDFTFNEYDPDTHSITALFGEVISFGSNITSTNTSNFVKDAELIKGFLDYKSLLGVYNHRVPKPNLFNLIVKKLLHNYIPPGGTYAFGSKFIALEKKSVRNIYNRNDVDHKDVLAELPIIEGVLRLALNKIFLQLNALLKKHFKQTIRAWYFLEPFIPYNYGGFNKSNWHITADLRLDIKLNGVRVTDHGDYLNEARLSAIAVCLYLAVILRNPAIFDYKILFLDDIFVGLDSTNRIPVLDIIQQEFSEHQIFITTYDRHLYEFAKRKFEVESSGKWKTVELFSGKDNIGNQVFDIPILIKGESNFEKGSQYLHDRIKPDFPASANYFRKTLEEIVQKYIPHWEIVDAENKVQIPEFKLGPLIFRAKRFLSKTGNNCSTINQIITFLPALLHPLSHHDITSPIFKGELIRIESLFTKWIKELTALNIPVNYKCSQLEGRDKVIFKFVIDATTGHFSFYELKTTEPICLKRNPHGTPFISDVHCFAEKCWGENNGARIPGSRKEFSNEEKEQEHLNFNSLQDAYDRLHASMIQVPEIGNFKKAVNYIDAIEFLDREGNHLSLDSIIVW